MQPGVVQRIEAGQAGQTDGAGDGEDDAQAEEDLLPDGDVGRQAALVPQPAVGGERQVQEDRRDDAAEHEQRLQPGGAHVGYVRDRLGVRHRRVVRPVRDEDPV